MLNLESSEIYSGSALAGRICACVHGVNPTCNFRCAETRTSEFIGRNMKAATEFLGRILNSRPESDEKKVIAVKYYLAGMLGKVPGDWPQILGTDLVHTVDQWLFLDAEWRYIEARESMAFLHSRVSKLSRWNKL